MSAAGDPAATRAERAKLAENAPILPTHIEETARTIAQLHADHYRAATPLQRIVDRTTAQVGRPRMIAALAVVALAWMILNAGATWLGRAAWDPPPFPALETLATLVALFTALLILTTQRREDQLSAHRDRLTLELAILNDRKAAKIIQLIEELRRDAPSLANRDDREATAMSRPSDPRSMLDAVKETHDEAAAVANEPEPRIAQVGPTTRAPG
jgi:uncharacterized membrane protein